MFYYEIENGIIRKKHLTSFENMPEYIRLLTREKRHLIGKDIFTIHVTDITGPCIRKSGFEIISELKDRIEELSIADTVRLFLGTLGHKVMEERVSPFSVSEGHIIHLLKPPVLIWGRYDLLETKPERDEDGKVGFSIWDLKTTGNASLFRFRDVVKKVIYSPAEDQKMIVIMDRDIDNPVLHPPYTSAIRQILIYGTLARRNNIPVAKVGLFYLIKPRYVILAKATTQKVYSKEVDVWGEAFSVDNIYSFTVKMSERLESRIYDYIVKNINAMYNAITGNNPNLLPPSENPLLTCRTCPFYDRCDFESKPPRIIKEGNVVK